MCLEEHEVLLISEDVRVMGRTDPPGPLVSVSLLVALGRFSLPQKSGETTF